MKTSTNNLNINNEVILNTRKKIYQSLYISKQSD